MAATLLTQEGLASLRELAWIVANVGSAEAEAFLGGIPDHYRTGLDRALQLFRDPLMGDPREEAYLGYGAPAFHAAVIALGLTAMNSPILTQYIKPESILSDDLPWISNNGPDRRFETLLQHEDAVKDMLFGVLLLAASKGEQITKVEVLLRSTTSHSSKYVGRSAAVSPS